MSVLACCFIVVVSLFLVLVVAFDFLIFIMQRERQRKEECIAPEQKQQATTKAGDWSPLS